MTDAWRLALSFALSLAVSGLGYRQGSLSSSGALAAVVVGTATAGAGGWEWGLLVIVFFVTSSALSHVGGRRKARVQDAQWEKGARRDWGQVAANGGLVSALAVLAAVLPHPALWAGAVAVLAVVTGDTWATEIGVLSARPPRLITTGRQVAAGVSGGVTPLGTLAALAGTACIGISALGLSFVFGGRFLPGLLLVALLGGMAGVMVDSLLGATLQAMAWCPRCRVETERRRHSCGETTVPLRGLRWLTNDAVNALSSALGGLVGVGCWMLGAG